MTHDDRLSSSSSRVLLLSDDDSDDQNYQNRNYARVVSGYCAGILGCVAVLGVVAIWTVHGTTLVMSTRYLMIHHSNELLSSMSNSTATTEIFSRTSSSGDDRRNHDDDDNIVAISWEEVAVARVILGALHLVFSMIYWATAWIKCPQRLETTGGQNWTKNCKGGIIVLNFVSYIVVTALSLLLLVKMAPNLKNLNNYHNLTALCVILLSIWETVGTLACGVHIYFKNCGRNRTNTQV